MRLHEDIDFEASAKPAVDANADVAHPSKYPIFDPSHRRLILPYN